MWEGLPDECDDGLISRSYGVLRRLIRRGGQPQCPRTPRSTSASGTPAGTKVQVTPDSDGPTDSSALRSSTWLGVRLVRSRLQRRCGRGDRACRRRAGGCRQVVEHAPCSVMVFREGHPASPAHLRGVLVGLDGSRGCMDALAMAQELAAALEARLVLCAAYPTGVAFAPPTSELRDELRANARSVVDAARRTVPGKPEIIEELGEGRARDVLLRACEHDAPAVLVLGRRGLGGFKRLLLGSTSRWLANHARARFSSPAAEGLHRPLRVCRSILAGDSGSAGGTGVVLRGAGCGAARRAPRDRDSCAGSERRIDVVVSGRMGVMAGLAILPVDPVDRGLVKVSGNGDADGREEAVFADRARGCRSGAAGRAPDP